MPLYDFHCKKCDKKWESFRKINDKMNESCPQCKGKATSLMTGFKSNPTFYQGYDLGLDVVITGPAHRRRIMKERNLFEKG